MPIPLLHSVLSWFLKKRVHQIELFLKYPNEVQIELLTKLVDQAKNTWFGKEYGFLVSQLVEYAKLCTSINEMASAGSQFGIARKRLEKVLEQNPNAKPIN